MVVAKVGAIGLGEYSEGVAVMMFYQLGEFFQGAEAELVQIIASKNEEQLDILTHVFAHKDAKVKLYLLNLSRVRSDVRSGVALILLCYKIYKK